MSALVPLARRAGMEAVASAYDSGLNTPVLTGARQMSMQVCRFCNKLMRHDAGVKYGTRHYAHFACYLDHKPLSKLKSWQVGTFPFRLIKDRGLMNEVERLTADV